MKNNRIESLDKEKIFSFSKTVYGPVKSWRFGQSLGIDPIFEISTCSFNCVYCQLGNIQKITNQRKIFVETQKVVDDFKELWEKNIAIDVVTYSGSGEPTLALNLSEMIQALRQIAPEIPQYILTNATTLYDPEVRKTLSLLDKVIIKLDGGTEEMFQRVNRPVAGLTLSSVIDGIVMFRNEYKGEIEVQTMFMPMNQSELTEYAEHLLKIRPHIVQLNTPKRLYPLSWQRENRGNHVGIHDHDTRALKVVTKDCAREIEKELRALTQLDFISIYQD